MKFWISQTDRRNPETGRNDDTNWMVRELGLDEILFEPPPPRPRLTPSGGMLDEDADDLPTFLSLPDPPAFPNRPWTKPEAFEVIERAFKTFSSVSDAADYFSELEYPLFPDLNKLLGEDMQEQELSALFQAAAWAVLCFAPRGTRPPVYSPEDLMDNLDRHVAVLDNFAEGEFSKAFSAWVQESRQPEMMPALMALFLTWLDKLPPEAQLRPGTNAVLVAALGGVVDTLDEAARAGS